MFIKRSEYDELVSDYYDSQARVRRLQDEKIELELRNGALQDIEMTYKVETQSHLEKIDELNVEIANLKSNLAIMKDRFKTSEEIRIKLIDQNGRLIDLLERYMKKEEEEHESKI